MATVHLKDLPQLAKRVLAQIAARERSDTPRAFVLALEGNLGAGKTTFVQHLARELGITDTVQSPTFILMRSYPIDFAGFTRLVHIDAYRLDTPKEFETLGPETFLNDPRALVCIEWPERVEGVLPKPDMLLKFKAGEKSEERKVEGI